MRQADLFVSLAVLGISLMCHAAQADEPARDANAPSLETLVEQLDSPKYIEREAASKRLLEAGKAAIDLVRDAARSESNEVVMRAFDILKQHLAGEDASLSKAAKAALEQLAADEQKQVARRAAAALDPPADRIAAAVPLNQPQPIIVGNAQIRGQIQIQVGGGGGNFNRMQVKQNGDDREINVVENGQQIDITENAKDGIKITVVEKVDGKEKKSSYEGKDLEDLKKNHPEGAKLYEKYSQRFNVQRAAPIRIAPAIQPMPAPVPATPAAAPRGEQQITQARKQLAEALETLKQSGGIDAETLKKLEAQIEEVDKQLGEVQKALK